MLCQDLKKPESSGIEAVAEKHLIYGNTGVHSKSSAQGSNCLLEDSTH